MKAGPPAQLVGVEVHEQQEALEPQSSVPLTAASNSHARTCDCLAHAYGNAADRPQRVPSDMTDAEWAVVRELLPVPGWLEGRGGQPEAYCHRQMVDAVRYLVLRRRAVRTGHRPRRAPRGGLRLRSLTVDHGAAPGLRQRPERAAGAGGGHRAQQPGQGRQGRRGMAATGRGRALPVPGRLGEKTSDENHEGGPCGW